jgi:hypothetical protein
MLTHQLMFVLHYTSVVLQHKSLVHHPLEVLKILSFQSIGQTIIQVIQETLQILFISVNFMKSMMRQLSERSHTCSQTWILVSGSGTPSILA